MSDDADRELEELRRLLVDQGLIRDDVPDPEPISPEASRALARRIVARAQRRSRLVNVSRVAAAVLVGVVTVTAVQLWPERTQAATTPAMLAYSLAAPADLDSAPAAHDALVQLAGVAAAGPEPEGEGTVQFVESYGWWRETGIGADGEMDHDALYPTFDTGWLAADGSSRVSQVRGAALDLAGRPVPGTTTGVPGTDDFPAGTFDAGLVVTLDSTGDLRALESALIDVSAGLPCGQDSRWHAECLVSAIEKVYGQYVVPPQLAGRFWQVLADESDLKDLGTTTDRIGNAAHAIALASDPANPARDAVTVLLVSTESGQLVGTEDVTLRDTVTPVKGPTVTSFTAWTQRQWVGAIGDEP